MFIGTNRIQRNPLEWEICIYIICCAGAKMTEPVFERIDRLLDDKEKSQQSLLTVLEMNRSTYSNWKLGKVNHI